MVENNIYNGIRCTIFHTLIEIFQALQVVHTNGCYELVLDKLRDSIVGISCLVVGTLAIQVLMFSRG